MGVYQKLLNVQSKLKAPKGQYNSFGKYSYRNCEDILEALKPILKEEQCAIFLSDELENIGDRYYIKATATLICIETSEKMFNTAYAREEETKKGMDGSQITGASSSYARKYALNGLFGIDDTKDSDGTNTHGKEEEKPKPKPNANVEQHQIELEQSIIEFANKYLTAKNIEIVEAKTNEIIAYALKQNKITSVKTLNDDEYTKLLNFFNSLIFKANNPTKL